jgi:hypothetical protein
MDIQVMYQLNHASCQGVCVCVILLYHLRWFMCFGCFVVVVVFGGVVCV